jgi:hypothetical protein
MRRDLKRGLHTINWALDDQKHLLHYHRVQLADLALEPDHPKSYTDFLVALEDERARPLADRVRSGVEALTPDRLEKLRDSARELIALLETRTGVPSAITLDRDAQP